MDQTRSKKWYKVEWECSFDLIKSAIAENTYNDQDKTGFFFVRSGFNFLEARHVSARYVEESYEGPKGESITNVREIYDIVRFKLFFGDICLMEITNPPRYMKSFNNFFKTRMKNIFRFYELSIDPLALVKDMDGFENKKIYHIEAAGINVANLGVGRIEVSSSKDIEKEFAKFLGNRHYEIGKVKAVLRNGDLECKIELTKGGGIKIVPFHTSFDSLFKSALEMHLMKRLK